MSTTQRVSDEVWRSVPEKKLPAGPVWTAVVAALVLAVAAIWASSSGLVVPDLDVRSSGGASTADSGRFEYRFDVTNGGLADVEVESIRLDADWLGIAAIATSSGPLVDGPVQPGVLEVPFTVPAGTTVPVTLVVTVDCDARTGQGVPIVLRSRAVFGTYDVIHQPWGSPPMIVGASMDEQPWPVAVSDWVCTPYTGETVDE